jgi:hypothetical protein
VGSSRAWFLADENKRFCAFITIHRENKNKKWTFPISQRHHAWFVLDFVIAKSNVFQALTVTCSIDTSYNLELHHFPVWKVKTEESECVEKIKNLYPNTNSARIHLKQNAYVLPPNFFFIWKSKEKKEKLKYLWNQLQDAHQNTVLLESGNMFPHWVEGLVQMLPTNLRCLNLSHQSWRWPETRIWLWIW